MSIDEICLSAKRNGCVVVPEQGGYRVRSLTQNISIFAETEDEIIEAVKELSTDCYSSFLSN